MNNAFENKNSFQTRKSQHFQLEMPGQRIITPNFSDSWRGKSVQSSTFLQEGWAKPWRSSWAPHCCHLTATPFVSLTGWWWIIFKSQIKFYWGCVYAPKSPKYNKHSVCKDTSPQTVLTIVRSVCEENTEIRFISVNFLSVFDGWLSNPIKVIVYFFFYFILYVHVSRHLPF